MVDLGEIKRVDLREVWPNEASDFTPWLAENLDKLGEALGLDLELQSAEAAVGAFSLDVLAHDLGSNRPVIIENQLETTNHNHLGQLLTYAAGYDAYAVVWLTREFRDEHRQALDWLNQRTGEDTQFFGVVVEAWQIDDSRPAPHFKPVATPNDWQKLAVGAERSSGNTAAVSERGERYRTFFQSLIDTLREEYSFTNARKGQPQSWYHFSSGNSGIAYSASFSRDGKASVNIDIASRNGEWNQRLFDRLTERKGTIQSEFSGDLVWDSVENRLACYVRVFRNGQIDDDEETLEAVQGWMVEQLLAFKRVFTPHLAELVK